MSRSKVLVWLGVVVVVFVVMIAPAGVMLFLTQAGRQDNVAASLAACKRSIPRNVAWINEIRADAEANFTVGTDPTQSGKTRDARLTQRSYELQLVAVMDAQTDQSAWPHLKSRTDRLAVRDGVGSKAAFHCNVAFPPARLLP